MKLLAFSAALLLIPGLAMAEVNTKNGDFYITYHDITQESGGHELNLSRTYNSKATANGWFGYGWGSPYETRLVVMPDNTVVVRDHGTGQTNYYTPEQGKNLEAGVDKIISEAARHDYLDAAEVEDLRHKLTTDAALRITKVLAYGIQSQLPKGAKAQMRNCPESVITRIDDEYQRTTCGSAVEYFDLAGHLIRQESDGYKFTIHYAGKYPDRIEDTQGLKIFLEWTAAGHIARTQTDQTQPVVHYYHYDEQDNLLLSNEIGGNFYRYDYDSSHNMTQIGYIDHTHMDMQYDESTHIKSVAEVDGSKRSYTYRTDPGNALHYWTTTTSTNASGEQSTKEEEFSFTADATGVQRLTHFGDVAGEGMQDVLMDTKGRVIRAHYSNGSVAEYFYHPVLNKISAIVSNKGSSIFTYDTAGNLIRLFNTEGQLIVLGYDSQNRIIRLNETNQTNHTHRELTFKYNALNKPIQIKLIRKGEINVEYNQDGEIAKVESKQGAKMALAVTEAFQTLLAVVKVGGVGFGM